MAIIHKIDMGRGFVKERNLLLVGAYYEQNSKCTYQNLQPSTCNQTRHLLVILQLGFTLGCNHINTYY